MQVFISHAHDKNGEFAYRLAEDLRSMGVDVWIAPESIRPGEPWIDAIQRGLKTSTHVLPILSMQSSQSKWVKEELRIAVRQYVEGELNIIPIELEADSRSDLFIEALQHISFIADYEQGLVNLCNRLGLNPKDIEDVITPQWLKTNIPDPVETALKILRSYLNESIPGKVENNFLIATWNLNSLATFKEIWGSNNVTKKVRDLDSLLIISEILSRFDLILLHGLSQEGDVGKKLFKAMNRSSKRWNYHKSELGLRKASKEDSLVMYDEGRIKVGAFSKQIWEKGETDNFLQMSPVTEQFNALGQSFKLLRFQPLSSDSHVNNLELFLKGLRKQAIRERSKSGNIIAVGNFEPSFLGEEVYNILQKVGFKSPDPISSRVNYRSDKNKYYYQVGWFWKGKLPIMKVSYGGNSGTFYISDDPGGKYGKWYVKKVSNCLPLWVELVLNSKDYKGDWPLSI